MNILYIYNSNIDPLRGGVQRVTKVLSDYFSQMGHSCYYLSSQSFNDNIVNQFVLPNPIIDHVDNVSYVKRLIEDKLINVVVNQAGLNKEMTRFVHSCCVGKVKIITVAHNSLIGNIVNFTTTRYQNFKRLHILWTLPLFNTKLMQYILRSMYRRKYRGHYQDIIKYSDKFVLLSDAYLNELSFFVSDYPEDKVCVIANPCTLPRISFSETEKKKVVLYVGRIDLAVKRCDLLLQIWKKIQSNNPDWILKIVGGGAGLPKIKLIAQKMNLNAVFFEGVQPPGTYYEEGAIFCMTSAYEGFPLVLAEAMNFGVVPILFDSFGSAKQIIDNGTDGFLIPPFDVEYYADRLNYLMNNKQEREKMSHSGMLKAKQFSIECIAKQWIDLFKG